MNRYYLFKVFFLSLTALIAMSAIARGSEDTDLVLETTEYEGFLIEIEDDIIPNTAALKYIAPDVYFTEDEELANELMEKGCADHVEYIYKRLSAKFVVFVLFSVSEVFCHIFACFADVAVENVGSLMEFKSVHEALIVKYGFLRVGKHLFFDITDRHNTVEIFLCSVETGAYDAIEYV